MTEESDLGEVFEIKTIGNRTYAKIRSSGESEIIWRSRSSSGSISVHDRTIECSVKKCKNMDKFMRYVRRKI